MKDYFKDDEYWKYHINKPLEEDMWLDDYKDYLKSEGLSLDLGCGIGQFTKKLMEYGYDVISAYIKNSIRRSKEIQ